MFKRTHLMASVALAVVMAGPLPAEENANASTVVATVNGEDITLGHVIVVAASLPDQYRNLPNDVLFTGILDQLIQQTALAQSASEELPQRVTLALENERRSLIASEEVERVLSEVINESSLQKAYDEKYSDSAPEQEFDASHILVETEEEALALITELEGGADFAELAKEHSTGPSGPRGGALGWFGPGMMVPAFEAAVVEMDKGGVSAPVQTQFGWHVIKLNDTRAKNAPAFEDVEAEIRAELSKSTIDAFIDEVTSKSTITRKTDAEINVDLIKDLTLLEK